MFRMNKNLILAAAIGVAITAPGAAFATNGMVPHGFGVKSKGLAGASTAFSEDSLAPATNPAGILAVDPSLDVGADWFAPIRSFDLGGTEFESDSEGFLVPNVGYVAKIDNNSSWGVAVIGVGGMNTDYDNGTGLAFSAQSPDGIDLKQLGILFTYARKLNEDHSVGISPMLLYQTFKTSRRGSDTNESPSNDANGFGVRLGWQGKVTPVLTLGASYSPAISMSEFDDYTGLFAPDKGALDFPAYWSVGAAYKLSDKMTLVGDYQTIEYSSSKAIDEGFFWDDMSVIKIGLHWQANDNTIYRFGISNGDQPIDGDNAIAPNYLAPGVMETHVTAGMSKKLSGGDDLNFAVMYAPEEEVDDTGLLAPPNSAIRMWQYELSVSYTKKF